MDNVVFMINLSISIILIFTIIYFYFNRNKLNKEINDLKTEKENLNKEIERKERVILKLKNEKGEQAKSIRVSENEHTETKLKLIEAKSQVRKVEVNYFSEIKTNEALFSHTYTINYYQQFLVDGLPVGSPTWISRNELKKYDKEQINKTLESFIKPILEAGVKSLTAYANLIK